MPGRPPAKEHPIRLDMTVSETLSVASQRMVPMTGLDKFSSYWWTGSMKNLDELFERLQRSSFRQRFRLQGLEREYLDRKGLNTVMVHAVDFVDKRLAPAYPANDGKQTPMRKHPVFVAQHATATCCRGCLEKWHAIPKGRALADDEKGYVLDVLRHWLESQIGE
jgi:hypothetical protein